MGEHSAVAPRPQWPHSYEPVSTRRLFSRYGTASTAAAAVLVDFEQPSAPAVSTALPHDLPAPAAVAEPLSHATVPLAAVAPAAEPLQQSAVETVVPCMLAANAAVLIVGEAPGATIADLIIDLWTLPAVVVLAPLVQHDAEAVTAEACDASLVHELEATLVDDAAFADADLAALSHANALPAAERPNAATVASITIFRVISTPPKGVE